MLKFNRVYEMPDPEEDPTGNEPKGSGGK